MPISKPARHPAFKPIGRLRTSPVGGGHKRGMMASLNLTPMVDMFTVIVIFLLQSFSANGELMFIQKDIKLPEAKQTMLLTERGPVLTVLNDSVLVEGMEVARVDEMDDTVPGIPGLAEQLTGIRERDEELYGRNPNEPFKGHVIIQSDKETDFRLIRRAIHSANEAGWTHLQFTVIGAGGVIIKPKEG